MISRSLSPMARILNLVSRLKSSSVRIVIVSFTRLRALAGIGAAHPADAAGVVAYGVRPALHAPAPVAFAVADGEDAVPHAGQADGAVLPVAFRAGLLHEGGPVFA